MSKIYDFEEEKLNNELLEKLVAYEEVMPSQAEIEKREDDLLCKNRIDRRDDKDYLHRLKRLVFDTIGSVSTAYQEYQPGNLFSIKRIKKLLCDYDVSLSLLNDYIMECGCDVKDEKIPEIEELFQSVNENYEEVSEKELELEIEKYLIITPKVYEIIFYHLENKTPQCDSLLYYVLRMSHISYYAIIEFLQKEKA